MSVSPPTRFLREFDTCKPQRHQAGSYIWRSGECVESVFLLQRGQVCVELVDSAGRPTVFRVVEPGHLFGLPGLCIEQGRAIHSSAVSTVTSDVVRIQRDTFSGHLKRNCDAMYEFVLYVCGQLAETENRIRVLAEHGGPERLAAVLVQLGYTAGRPSVRAPGYYRIHCTHAHLARLTAMTRSHVSTMMARFRQKSLVQYGRNRPPEVHLERLIEMLRKRDADFHLDRSEPTAAEEHCEATI